MSILATLGAIMEVSRTAYYRYMQVEGYQPTADKKEQLKKHAYSTNGVMANDDYSWSYENKDILLAGTGCAG